MKKVIRAHGVYLVRARVESSITCANRFWQMLGVTTMLWCGAVLKKRQKYGRVFLGPLKAICDMIGRKTKAASRLDRVAPQRYAAFRETAVASLWRVLMGL